MAYCVYTHATPDGKVFYVGYGSSSRAHALRPGARNAMWREIVWQHGAKNIIVHVFICETKEEAHAKERELIAELQPQANIAKGSGTHGLILTERRLAGLAKGRLRGLPAKRWSLERRQRMSEQMKEIRSKKYWCSPRRSTLNESSA